MSGYVPRITEIGRQTGLTDDEIKGRPLAGKHGHDECERGYCEPLAETANLKAHIQTLQGRLEAVERAQAADREVHLKVRRAIGQLAAAVGLMPK
jgi:hypothetical protein